MKVNKIPFFRIWDNTIVSHSYVLDGEKVEDIILIKDYLNNRGFKFRLVVDGKPYFKITMEQIDLDILVLENE